MTNIKRKLYISWKDNLFKICKLHALIKPKLYHKPLIKLEMKLCSVFFLLIFYACCNPSLAQTSQQQNEHKLQVLMIGNSFSRDAAKYLLQITKDGNHQMELTRAEMAGSSLDQHLDSALVNQKDTLRGKPYAGKSLKQLLMMKKWDIVSIQQKSLISSDSTSYYPFAEQLYNFIKKYSPGAQVIVHETWPYRSDSNDFGRLSGNKWSANQEEMYDNLRASYHLLAKKLDASIIPTGDAFYMVATDKKWKFIGDSTYDRKTAEYPSLPTEKNSLNMGYYWRTNNGKVLIFDPHHASPAGCYLAGLVWYATLFNADPTKINFRPKEVDAEFADFLKRTAKETVAKSK